MSLALIGGALELFDSLPETDQQQCLQALDDGDYINASFVCPAGVFLSQLFRGGPDDEDEDDTEDQ